MKILVLTSTFPRWANDTEPKFVDYLCEHLSADNDIHVLAPHDAGIPVDEQLSDRVRITRFRYAPERWESLAYNGGILPNLRANPSRFALVPLFLLAQLWAVTRLLRKNNYDIVHAHWIIPQGIVLRIAYLLLHRPPPLVLTSHGGDLFALKGRFLGSLKAWVLAGANAVTVVSSEMKKKAANLGVPEDKLDIIPMGVDCLETFVPPGPDTTRAGLIFVGRLVDKKGVEYLLRAMPAILARHPEEQLRLIGDGPLRPMLEGLCQELGITSSVTFLGAVANRDIPALLQEAAIAVIPSVVADTGDQEGAPVSIMETLASGNATVVSNYPGAQDIIEDGVNGYLVDQRAPEQIATRVLELLARPQLRAALGAAGRRTVAESFDWRVVSAKFQQVFDRVTVTG